MATQTPSITKTSLRSSRSALPRFPVNLLDKTDQARITDFSTNTTPSISNSHKADLPGSPTSSKTSVSFFDGSGYLPSISNSPERLIHKMAPTKATRASQQAETPAPIPASTESATKTPTIEHISRGKRKIKPTQKARELHDDTSSKYYASLQTKKDVQTRAEDQSEQLRSSPKLNEAAEEDVGNSLAPSTRKRKRAQSVQFQEHPAQTSSERADVGTVQEQAANLVPEEYLDENAARPSKRRKQEKPVLSEVLPSETEVEKLTTQRISKSGKARASKGKSRPVATSDASGILGTDTEEMLEIPKPNTPVKPTETKRKTRASSKTQKPKENLSQPAQQPLVTKNGTIITIHLPSATLRQFVQTPEITAPPAAPTVITPSSPTNVPGLFSLDFPTLPCRLTCLVDADPSVLALAVTTAIAEMADPGTDHEAFESFDQDDFKTCLIRQCTCTKTRLFVDPSKVPVSARQSGNSTQPKSASKEPNTSSRRVRRNTSKTKQKDVQPQSTASQNENQVQSQTQTAPPLPPTKTSARKRVHSEYAEDDELDLEQESDKPKATAESKPRKKKKTRTLARAGSILDDGEGSVMVFTGHEWI